MSCRLARICLCEAVRYVSAIDLGAVFAPGGRASSMQPDSGQERTVKALRVMFALLALAALPLVAAAAQGSSTTCKPMPAASRGAATGRAEAPGQLKKCPPAPTPVPVPPPPSGEQPPSGPHKAKGVVYEDVDGDGDQNMFAGDLGLAGWTVRLYWNGQQIGSKSTDADGNYEFAGLGSAWYTVCVGRDPGYDRTEPNGEPSQDFTTCGGDGRRFELTGPFEVWGGGDYGYWIPLP